MYRTLQDFVAHVEGRLLRSLTEEEWKFTCWMYEQYEAEVCHAGEKRFEFKK